MSILITGASGFVGKHFVEELTRRAAPHVPLSSTDCDLTDLDATLGCFACHPETTTILHLASYQAAGDFPALHPADQTQINSRIHLNVLQAWQQLLPHARLVASGTSCGYPVQDRPLREDTYMDGAIHGSVYAYAMTKRLLYTGIQAANDQHGLNGSYLIPATMFGEYDDFQQDTAHVCGALINRFCRAARERWPQVEVWGDGSQIRDLMDVKEFVRVVLELIPSLNRSVLNIGPGSGTSIRQLAETVKHCSGYTGKIFFNADKYTGVQSKLVDTTKLEIEHNLSVTSNHEPGLARTISWYQGNYTEYQDKRKFVIPQMPKTDDHIMIVMYGWADSGGGTILPRQVAKGLAQRGHRVSVFYAAAKPRPDLPAYGVAHDREDHVDLYGIFNRPSTFMDALNPQREVDDPAIRTAFRDLLTELRPDVVHFFNLHNLGMSLPGVCHDAGIPTALSSNNYWAICPRLYLFDGQLNPCATTGTGPTGAACVPCLGNRTTPTAHAERSRAADQMLNQDLDVHLAVSHRVQELYIRNGVTPENIRVLQQQPESLDIIWQRVGSQRQIKPRAESPLRVGFIGSLLPHKGVHVLVTALQAFGDKVRGILHGDVQADYARHLQQLDNKGIFELGGSYSIDEMPDRLAEPDIVVVPSIWEDCAPFVVAEALAARAPVIGSRTGGIPDFIDDGVTGFLFEPGNPQDLARKILPFLQDPGLLGRMQSFISRPRGFQAYLDDLLEVYAGLRGIYTRRAKNVAEPSCPVG